MAKRILSEQAVIEIREAAALRWSLSNKLLAAKYGVAPDTIKNVIHNEICKRSERRRLERAKASA